jgi:hypothetical protein
VSGKFLAKLFEVVDLPASVWPSALAWMGPRYYTDMGLNPYLRGQLDAVVCYTWAQEDGDALTRMVTDSRDHNMASAVLRAGVTDQHVLQVIWNQWILDWNDLLRVGLLLDPYSNPAWGVLGGNPSKDSGTRPVLSTLEKCMALDNQKAALRFILDARIYGEKTVVGEIEDLILSQWGRERRRARTRPRDDDHGVHQIQGRNTLTGEETIAYLALKGVLGGKCDILHTLGMGTDETSLHAWRLFFDLAESDPYARLMDVVDTAWRLSVVSVTQ